ncbi:phosphatidylethanolamine-binding protein 4 isoform X1 [Brienomyrus brachyistius]|uniref:phosphatidylethanolamine-binding protein 4 isoform X1 n=1 Tax=Brienomyrus brachyistius TaxID=42636 RepID=UPI0020B353FA|nr:phosphatidylethanolamine-binding protein 4 isoform X1 [Brienomyrus brachyistius]
MQISMQLLRIVSVLVAAELLHLVCGGTSAEETLSDSDARFCHGGLSLMYPGLAVDRCLVVPRERSLRERLSSEWGAPQVRWERAKEKKYTLMMVDPDAPSRCNPTKSHWRHWLVVDIMGAGTHRPLSRSSAWGAQWLLCSFSPRMQRSDGHLAGLLVPPGTSDLWRRTSNNRGTAWPAVYSSVPSEKKISCLLLLEKHFFPTNINETCLPRSS